MTFRIRQVKTFRHIDALNDKIFPDEPYERHEFGTYWLLYADGKPIGFAGFHPLVYSGEFDTVFLSRSGILDRYRGKGLGARLLDTRLSYARKMGYDYALTYTIDNIPSANNLISRGFKLYDPEYRFGSSKALHWIKKLSD